MLRTEQPILWEKIKLEIFLFILENSCKRLQGKPMNGKVLFPRLNDNKCQKDTGTECRWLKSWQWLVIFLFTTVSRPAVGPTHPCIQWIPGALSLGVKRPGREAGHSSPTRVKVKNMWSYTFAPPTCHYGRVLR